MEEKSFDKIPSIKHGEEKIEIIAPKEKIPEELNNQFWDWYYENNLRNLPKEERNQKISEWWRKKGYETKSIKANLDRAKIPIKSIWEELKRIGENPYDLIKWVAGKTTNKLSKLVEKSENNPEKFYAYIENANLEIGYVKFPMIGESSLNEKEHLIEEGENVVDLNDTIHYHPNCLETYILKKGKIVLRTGINNAIRLKNIKEIPQRYEMDGEKIVLDLTHELTDKEVKEMESLGAIIYLGKENEVKAIGFTITPNNYHIITHVDPSTELLILKTPKDGWDEEGNWNDKFIHPCEKIYSD